MGCLGWTKEEYVAEVAKQAKEHLGLELNDMGGVEEVEQVWKDGEETPTEYIKRQIEKYDLVDMVKSDEGW